MKKLYFLLLVACGLLGARPAQAQEPLSGSDSLRRKLTSIFANIDKSQVPTGYLYEATPRLISLLPYNGTLTDSSRTDMDVLRYLRLMLANARVYGTETLPTLSTYNTRLDAAVAASGGVIPVSMQYMSYNTIRPDALQNNLLRVQNEQVFDVAGRPQNPYEVKVLFAAAPVRSFAPTNRVSFIIRRDLYLTNATASTYPPQIDFGDGRGYQPGAWDQPVSTTYATAGLKRVKVKLPFIYSNGTPESWFDFNVLSVAPGTLSATKSTTTANATANSAAADFERPFTSSTGSHSGGTAFVIYGNSPAGVKHTQLTKSFIISEGYNLYSIAPELRECNNPNNTIDDFFKNININFVGPQGNVTGNFQTKLLNAGYDIVYIDNANGSDDIVRNARLFEDVVNWVNDNKVGGRTTGEKNVVMGQSMGGLVSRYGLARMTKYAGGAHTRLLILHDSPQRGANNPVGVQSLTRSFDVPFIFGQSLADLNGQIKAAVRVLNQPASQQLSILNAFNGRGTDIRTNTFFNGAGDYAQMVSLSAPYSIIAVSNGSQCGRAQSTPTSVAITESALAVLIPIPVVGLAGITGNLGAYGLPAYGQQAIISRANIRLEYRIRIGYCPFCVTIPIRFNLLKESALSPPNTLPYETLPGGSTNPAQQAGNCADGFDLGSLNGIYAAYLRTRLYNGDLCFVPSYSALDVPTVTPTTAFAKYINNFTDNPSAPRVARYIAQESVNSGAKFNVAHISFTPRNSEWLFNEMQGLAHASNYCSTECSAPLTITNPAAQGRLCAGSSVTLSIPNLPAGTSVSWSTSPAGYFTPATGTGPTFTATAANAQGTVTITALVGACQVPVTTTIGVGPAPIDGSYYCGSGCVAYPPTQGQLSGFTVVPPGTYTINLSTTGNRTYGAWQGMVDGGRWSTYSNNTSGVVTLSAGQRAQFTVPFSGSACGAGSGTFSLAAYSSYRLVATPNPASSELTVTAVDEDQPEASLVPSTTASPFEAELYDNHGKKVKAGKSEKGKAVLDVRDLPAGLYNLRAGKGKEAISEHIQVTH
ncbi:T9SS type A sorting domain-containing protein [uncultured Hymenobacter sp.]|uniref:T9SS type A sorting domain-containing protein n=1 Tax=uncultured Hymenobacter sp. TaxID=170016 RepID=UPI0035C9509D